MHAGLVISLQGTGSPVPSQPPCESGFSRGVRFPSSHELFRHPHQPFPTLPTHKSVPHSSWTFTMSGTEPTHSEHM